jgi:periplasmic protein TonB
VKRIPRLLLVAFALSLLLHVIVAVLLHPPSFSTENKAEVVSIERRSTTIAVAKVPPPPPPTPPPKRPVPRPRGSALPIGKAPGPGRGSGTPAPTPAPAQPAAAASAIPSAGCSQPNAVASVVATPPPPDIAPDTRASATTGTALVSVALDSAGDVTGTTVTQSTGNSSLDIVAVTMAREARYAPALRDCKPVTSAYTFSAKFVAW